MMVRQCAWCLRLIDDAGERISLLPKPKIYEATHGMCYICGQQWIEQAIQTQALTVTPVEYTENALFAHLLSREGSQTESGSPVGVL